MRLVLIFGCAALASAIFGCSSNPASRIAGPTQTSELSRPPGDGSYFDPNDEFIGPPIRTELDTRPSNQTSSANGPTVAP